MATRSSILAWWGTVHGVARVRHNLATKQQQQWGDPPASSLETPRKEMKAGRRMMGRELSPPTSTQSVTTGRLPGPKMLAVLGQPSQTQPHPDTLASEVASAYSTSLLFIVIAFLTFYFVLELTIQLTINNVVIVSGGQGRDSAMYKHVSILPQTPLPSRLPHNIEQSSLCCSGGPCWLSILNIVVCACPSQAP